MKKVLSVILSILMILNTALAYTSTVQVKGIGISVTSEEGNAVEIIPKTSEITGWTVKSGNTTVTDNKFVMPGGNVVIEGVTTNTGYTFSNWTATGITLTSSQQTSKTITFTMPGNDVTLVANYTEGGQTPQTYTISYNVNNGTGIIASQTKTHGIDLTLTTTELTRSGYNSLGWATSNSATSAEYTSGGTFTTNADIILQVIISN